MTKIRTLQLYRGTTAQNDAYTGSAGELTMDTTTNELRLHDGSTAGGHVIGSGGGGSSYHPDLFDPKWADHILNDVQWLRADTFSWQSGAVYQVAYQHLEDDIDGKTLQSETVAGTTIQFYLADDGHKICPASEESNVTAIYNATGVAWYYIIDTVNTRFKLPRTKFGLTGLRDTVGKYVEAGLPNITGSFITRAIDSSTGAFSQAATTSSVAGMGNVGSTPYTVSLDASDSSSIYGNSTTVQPPATQMYLYFYVGEFTQTALENTAGLNASLFNGKADLDLGNVSATGKATSVGWVMPDYSAGISLSGWQATNTNFTVPCAGYIQVVMATTGGALETFYIDDIPCCALINSFTSYVGNAVGGRFIEGGVHTFRSAVPSRTQSVIFYPCKGVL